MTLPIFQRTITDEAGNVIPNATVEARLESTGLLATIYSDRAGTATITNPLTTGPDGFAQFYAAGGDYRIKATDPVSGDVREWRYVPIWSPDSDSTTTSTGSQTVAGALDDRDIAVADLTALKALVTTGLPDGAGARITSTGRAGGFSWDSSDLSTEVAADTSQGVYVAPSGGDGTTGAWVRAVNETPRIEWFGARDSASLAAAQLVFSRLTTASGNFDLDTSVSITSVLDLERGTVFRPETGVVLTVEDGAHVISKTLTGWVSLSLGGTVTYAAGSTVDEMRQFEAEGGPSWNYGWAGNTLESGTSYVFGGTSSFPNILQGPNSSLSVIGGGYDNLIEDGAIASTMAGGAHHIIKSTGTHGTIGGGSYQEIWESYGFVGAGTENVVRGTYGAIVAGNTNNIGDGGKTGIDIRSSFIGAGTNNFANGLRSNIVGGTTNTATGDDSIVGAGNNNLADGSGAVVGGGNTNTASGVESVSAGGTSNQSLGDWSFTAGSQNTAAGNYAFVTGEFCETVAGSSGSMAQGRRSKAHLRGQKAFAAGLFSARGDAQMSDLVVRRQTTDATPVALTLQGASDLLILPDDSTWVAVVYITARRTDANENAGYKLEACIKRDTGAATVAFVGTPVKTVYGEDDATWDVSLSANTSDGSLDVNVTGAAAKSINWVGRVELTETVG